jgi:uncharacterized alkaline shock family protein YloU
MDDYPQTEGKTTIDPGVLIKIAKITALGVPGVSRMAIGPHSINNIIKQNYQDGVKIEVENDSVYADLFLVMHHDVDLLKTGRVVQQKVGRAITEMVGMEVGRINVHIEDIDYTDSN